jgi:putative SOS response-associated peptidase YedK
MCGRYGFSIKDAREVIDRFDLLNTIDEIEKLENSNNVGPGNQHSVIVQTSQGNKIGRFFWGLIPYWAKDESMKYSTINARADRVAEAASYRKPFRSKRCLVPASHFYEPDKSVKPSIPYLFKLKNDELFCFAGLYDIWTDKETNKEIYSYTIITVEPNELVEKIHPRMPAILKKSDEKNWLNPDLIEPEQLHPMLQTYPASEMTGFRISQDLWKWKDDKEIIKPVADSKI